MLRRFAISCIVAAIALQSGARTRPGYGGVLRVEVAGDPWRVPDGMARRLVLDGLTTLDANGNVGPALALDWQADDNAHRWQFRLRPGVRFQEGSPLTSTAVVMSLNLSCTDHCPWMAVRAVGSLVVFTSDSPMPNLPVLLAGDSFLVALSRTTDGQTPANPIGTGAFQYATFKNGVFSLSANDNCWQGRPFVDEIDIIGSRPVRDQWLDLSVGHTDFAEVPPQELRPAKQQRLNVIVSPPVELLTLQASNAGNLANPVLRASIAQAVDRSALFNVVFQKQGAITASLLPQGLTGYSFLFPAERDLNKANNLRGGLTPPPLTLATDGDGTVQLAAQRIALNLHEAGFNVQVVNARSGLQTDLFLRKLPLVGADPVAALEILLASTGEKSSVPSQDRAALFRAERDVLDLKTLVPLLELPRAWAVGSRVRDLKLRADGMPDLAGVSLGGTQ